MGLGGSKHGNTEHIVAEKVDKSQSFSKQFTILRLHGDTGALIAGSLATLLLLYVAYRGVLWKRAKMQREREVMQREREVQVPRAVWGGPGRMVGRRAPPPSLCGDQEVCNDCRAGSPHDVLQGRF